VGQGILELERSKLFSSLSGHERHFVPRSEYLFKLLPTCLEDLLYLGNSFEELFDRFEILLALCHAHVTSRASHNYWGPLGRFAWKHRSQDSSIYTKILLEAATQKANWPILKAGLFDN